ncbi:MAG: hypothetical protein GY780_06555 [bacterium]|nr:hypothetical protein [bacterium]
MKKLTLIILALLIASPVIAVDYWGGPPQGTWDRGEAGSTFQHWTFDTPAMPGPPTVFDNPYGEPMFELIGNFEYGEWECPIEMDPSGFIHGWHCIEPDGGSIVLRIPNTEFTDGEKKIFLQITSSKGPNNVAVQGHGANGNNYASGSWNTGLPHIQWGQPAPYGGMWYTYNYGRYIVPNPQEETITIDVSYCTVIDQIVVDTICTGTVPTEQTSMDMLKALYR